MKRTLAVMVLAGAVVATMAWPASAKGEGPVGATISGPGIGNGGPGGPGGPGTGSGGSGQGPGAAAVGTIDVRSTRAFEPYQNSPLWRLASFTGASGGCGSCMSFIDTSPPKDRASLGPAYVVTYFVGTCCAHSVRQMLYPFAPGGPWAHTLPHHGTRVWFVNTSGYSWWHADQRMGQLFLRFLHHLGVPRTNPAPVAPAAVGGTGAAAASTTAGRSAPWRLPLAIGVLGLLLVVGAVLARPRPSARPA
jgi:hypothetical protein